MLDDGIIIDQILGGGAGISGDFSINQDLRKGSIYSALVCYASANKPYQQRSCVSPINVELGYRVRKGEIIGRVKNTMVTGNVYTALKQLVELGIDGEWNSSCCTPHLIVEGLSTIGKMD